MKKGFIECPFCKNEIKEGAKKCQYCKEFLNPDDAPSKEVPGQTVGQTKAVKKKSMGCRGWIGIIFLIGIIVSAIVPNTETNKTNNNTIATTTETKNFQYIPGLTNADIQLNLEKKGFTCEKNLKDGFWTRCKLNGGEADHDVEIYGTSATKIYLVDAMTINYTNNLNKDFLGYIASLPYDTAEPERAKNRVIENIGKNNTTEIGGVKFEIESNNGVVRLYIGDKNQY